MASSFTEGRLEAVDRYEKGMNDRITDWANDKTICKEGRKYAELHPTAEEYYHGYESHYDRGVLHPEWFFFRINERWPNYAVEIARDLLLTLDKNVLSEKSKAAYDDAINFSLTNGALSKHAEEMRLEANKNATFERAVYYLIRWRLGEKLRPAGALLMMVAEYMKQIGKQNVEADLVRWLQIKVPIEMWKENLEA